MGLDTLIPDHGLGYLDLGDGLSSLAPGNLPCGLSYTDPSPLFLPPTPLPLHPYLSPGHPVLRKLTAGEYLLNENTLKGKTFLLDYMSGSLEHLRSIFSTVIHPGIIRDSLLGEDAIVLPKL